MAERLVVVGGDAAGMTAATNARRGRPDLEIVVLEKGRYTSYSACGIPYLVGGHVDALDDLVVRTPQEHRDRSRIDVRMGHEVTGIDLDARRIEAIDLDRARSVHLGFDQLMIATGARPLRPELPGIHEPWVRGVQTLDDAQRLLDLLEPGVKDAVVVGGGYIGLEMAEAFIDRGIRVTVVERDGALMGTVDRPIADRICDSLRRFGAVVHLDTSVTGFGDGVVHTDQGDLRADIAVLGLGVAPNAGIAAEAGITTGARGAISVDHRQQTSADGVWAAGDCAEVHHLVSRRPVHIALGTVANKTGRVAGLNIGGTYATFPGVLGTAVTRLCAIEVGRTGLTSAEAEAAGIEVVVGQVESTSRAHYFPGSEPVVARLLVERGRGRVVGAQIVGADRVGKRIDVMATAITAAMTVWDVIDLDLGYAPSVATTWDPWQTAARVALKNL